MYLPHIFNFQMSEFLVMYSQKLWRMRSAQTQKRRQEKLPSERKSGIIHLWMWLVNVFCGMWRVAAAVRSRLIIVLNCSRCNYTYGNYSWISLWGFMTIGNIEAISAIEQNCPLKTDLSFICYHFLFGKFPTVEVYWLEIVLEFRPR